MFFLNVIIWHNLDFKERRDEMILVFILCLFESLILVCDDSDTIRAEKSLQT